MLILPTTCDHLLVWLHLLSQGNASPQTLPVAEEAHLSGGSLLWSLSMVPKP